MKFKYFNQCDRWRTSFANGEQSWQLMMSNKTPISMERFKERVDFSGLLNTDDKNDTVELFISNDSGSGFYLSDINGTKVLFLQTSGYEFIFTVDGEEPVFQVADICNEGPNL